MFPEKYGSQFIPELGKRLIQSEGFQRNTGGDGKLLTIVENIEKETSDLFRPE